jgi:putative RNA 2'-phosphotransferase
METKKLKDISRSLSYYLRHNPSDINIVLDDDGYTSTDVLLNRLDISQEELNWIVDTNNKKRFSYNTDKSKIRAAQGHSVDVRLEFKTNDIPDILYHGTNIENAESIMKNGIHKMNRTHVHLSGDISTATNVGKRKGEVVILKIDSKQMILDNNIIFVSENGVYLTDHVNDKYISKLL